MTLLGAAGLAAPRLEAQKIAEVFQIDRRVSPRTTATYFDLIVKVLPDARVRERNTKNAISVILRSITDVEPSLTVQHENLFGRYGKTIFVGPMALKRVQSMRVQTASGERLLLLLSIVPKSGAVQDNSFTANEGARMPEPAAILALFRVAPEVELLDAADVKRDAGEYSEAFFSDSFLPLRVAARQDAFFIVNRPIEPNRYVLDYALLTVENDRIKLLSEEAFSEIEANGCENRSKAKTFVSLGRRTKRLYRTVQIRQLLTLDAFTSDCRRLIARDLLSVVKELRWNEAEKQYAPKEISSRRTNAFYNWKFRRSSCILPNVTCRKNRQNE